MVLFIFREEYYLKNKMPKEGTEEFFKWQADMDSAHGIAEVIVGKQRHGPTGTVRLHFADEFTALLQPGRGRRLSGALRGIAAGLPARR